MPDPGIWYNWDFSPGTVVYPVSINPFSVCRCKQAYVDIEVERKGLEGLLRRVGGTSKGGRPRHSTRPAIEAELERLIDDGGTRFKRDRTS